MSDDCPILHPEILQLTEQNKLLREELAQLMTEADDLLHLAKPNLLALYQAKIGVHEFKALEAQVRCGRLKRQLELIQASLNRGERPNPVEIECAVEIEFLDWQARLHAAAEKIAAAESHLRRVLRPQDDQELKKLYYGLAKRLHPDANPHLTDEQRRLWTRVQAAYRAADLAELRALALIATGETGAAPAAPKPLEELRREQARLRERLHAALQQLERIASEPPFTWREELEDESRLAARREEISRRVRDFSERSSALQAQIEILLGPDHGPRFGKN
jgi:hypothetical protein